MTRWLALFASAVVLSWTSPATAQRTGPTAAQVEALMADIGGWTIDYSAVLAALRQSDSTDEFVAILDKFNAGDIAASPALTQIDAWRNRAASRLDTVRNRAGQLRPPPSLTLLGPDGERLGGALTAAYTELPMLIEQSGRVDEAMAEMGVAAIGNPEQGLQTRQRAVFLSSIQLLRLDMVRVEATSAALPAGHPNGFLMQAIHHYYGALIAFPTYELAQLDGGADDRAALASALRRAASGMRRELAQCGPAAERISQSLRWRQSSETDALTRMMLQMLETFPESVRAYEGLAASLDAAAARIEAGEASLDVWAGQEEEMLPLLDEIARLEGVRARLAMGNRDGT